MAEGSWFAGDVYRLTKGFPRSELFGLTMQLRRASVSVAANIAEGSSRSGKDRARFLEIAYGSLNEIATMLYIAKDQGFVSAADLAGSRAQVSEMCKMLSGLKRAVIDRDRAGCASDTTYRWQGLSPLTSHL